MYRTINLSEEEKAEILAQYQDKSIKTSDICKQYNFSPSKLINLVREAGIEPRMGNQIIRRNKKSKVCGHCHKTIHVAEAKFCPYCGHGVLTEGEIVIESLTGLFQYGQHLPLNDREPYRITLNKAIEYIRSKG